MMGSKIGVMIDVNIGHSARTALLRAASGIRIMVVVA